ncbi:MAG: sn-glycerol-3-phosphate ABC transporter ATP-binding protein UgpC [Desulfobacteraceae bacterium]|nr:sn-glycerol-3-phosphate ABC transporter ATP-binding protein UgpC [Desulfobacteraceae bacterium]
MASLGLKRISKRFGDVVALSKVDLDINEGEFCVLLGPSGCGKSTLLQIVAGLTSQDEGSVLVDNKPVDHLSPRDRDVAMVFQNYALYPHMTVAQNLGFGLRMRGIHKDTIWKRITETASLLGIEDLLKRRPRELSGGQRQRVAMGRALVRRPKLFLLDEPLSNLDARLRINVRMELMRLHQQIQGTILYVTHDQVEAMTLGDKVIVMKEGRVHQIDPPETIYNRPADTFVATFIGSPVMNLFKGKLTRAEGRLTFFSKDFSLKVGDVPSNLENFDVEVGIRPEDIEIAHGREKALRAKVEMISNVGAEKYVHTRLGTTDLTIRVTKRDSFQPGETIPLFIDPSRLHFFYKGRSI